MTNISRNFEMEYQGPVTILRFEGDLDADTSLDINQEIDAALMPETTSFVVNMENVDFLDSHGVGLFAVLLKRAHERGGMLTFCKIGDQPKSVLHMVGFGDMVTFHNREEDALALISLAG